MTPEEELKYYQKAYAREKAARKEAERILEVKAEELYNVNKKLLFVNANLEQNLIKRTEQIKIAEQQYRQLVETANDVIFRVDLYGNFTYVNHTGISLSGYTLEEIIGKNFTLFVDSRFHKPMIQAYQDQLENETQSTYFEYKLINSDQEEIWLGQNVQLVYKDGYAQEFIAVARNITERVISDDALKKSNEKYKNLFEGNFDGVVQLNGEGSFVEWNSKFESLLGYSTNELNAMHISDVLHHKDIDSFKNYSQRLLSDGFYNNYIGKFIAKSGKIIDIEINSTATYENGKLSGSIDNVRDITERMSLEKAIIRSEEKYRGIIENLEFGLLEVNTDGLIAKVYPSFCKLTGYEPQELIGSDPYDLLHPDYHGEMDSRTKQREEGKSSVYEVKIKQKSGIFKWVIISGAPFYDEHGNYSGSVGVHLDISTQKQMENDLKEANQIAQASSKAKELFLANMSHEIRTPLNAVIGLSNLLQNTTLNTEQAEYATNIYNSAQSLILLVNDILDISKIESGKLEVTNAPFNLQHTVGTILSSSSYLAEQKQLELILKIDDKLNDNYVGDELKICQILINLLNNAVKFTSTGTVTLCINEVTEIGDMHEIEFAVEDTGKGIAQNALKTVFEDFSQEDSNVSKEYGGTGLGLSISKKLVNAMGGELEVTSEIEKGTRFYFTLVLKCSEVEAEMRWPEKANHINWSEVNILVVEDNLINQFVIESTVKSWGGTVDIANNGEEALEVLIENKYNIVLMDVQMPIMDGITATKFIRQEMKSNIPIIAFTANALKKEMERCLAVGMNDYITKPFQEEELKYKILNLILAENDEKAFLPKQEESIEHKTEPLFTTERLIVLSRGDNDFVTRMVQIFHEEGSAQLEQFTTSKDPEEIARLAHKIKPSIGYISNQELKDLVHKIEQKDFIDDPSLLETFQIQLAALLQAAKSFQKDE